MTRKMFKRISLPLTIILVLCGIYPPMLPLAGDSLKVAYKSNNPYYAYQDASGNTVGLQVDIMNALVREMKLAAVEYYPMNDINSCIEALEAGKVDAILGFPVFFDGDTSNILISTEITTIDLCMMATKENAEQIHSGELKNYAAVFEHNTNNYMIVANMDNSLYYVSGSQSEVLDTMLSGKAQVMVCDEDCISMLLKEQGLENAFTVIRNNVNTVGYSVAVRKGDDSLLRTINEGIFRIRMDGQYENILEQWIEKDRTVDMQQLFRNIVIIMGVFLIIASVYLFFNRRMRRLLQQRVTEVTGELEINIQHLKHERNLRNQVIEHDPNSIILCDMIERVLLMNAAARHLTEYFGQEDGGNFDGESLWKIPGVGRIVSSALKAEKACRICAMEHVLVTEQQGGKQKRSYRCSIVRTHFSEIGTGYLITIADVTEEENRKQERIEQEKSMALSRLVAGIAHEIKNPLTGIQNFADLIKTEKDNPEFWDYFETYVPIEISRISRLIEGLMNYSRPAKAVRETAEVAVLIDESMYLMNTAVRHARIGLQKSVPEGLWIYAGKDQIKQVLINIVLNSMEAIEKKRLTKGVASAETEAVPEESIISIQAYLDQNDVCIEIADEGGGMTEEELKSCMDPFYTTKDHGTGLGLAISRQFVQENGGTMHIDSTPGSGTTITLQFRQDENPHPITIQSGGNKP